MTAVKEKLSAHIGKHHKKSENEAAGLCKKTKRVKINKQVINTLTYNVICDTIQNNIIARKIAAAVLAEVMMLRACKDVILREIAGEYILVPVGEAALKLHGMITVSESGYVIWQKLCEGDCSEEGLVKALCAEYEVDGATAAADVREFLCRLSELGLVSEVSGADEPCEGAV